MTPTDAELADLYQRYGPVLLARCRRILRNEEAAQDAVQETFVRVVRNWDGFRQTASPLTWMYRISTNYCLNQVRNGTTRSRKIDDHRQEIGEPITLGAEGDPDGARVLALLDQVDEQTRACVVHTFFDDCTRDETAELVGLSVPTVRKRVNEFLDLARRAFQAASALILLSPWIPWSTPWT